MPNLANRLNQLEESLAAYGPNDPLPWSVGRIFNAVLEEVKVKHGDDPVVTAIHSVDESDSGGWVATENAGGLRAAAKQLLLTLPGASARKGRRKAGRGSATNSGAEKAGTSGPS